MAPMSLETNNALISKSLIEKRAFYKKEVRSLLESWGVLEVDVPALGQEACPDPSSLPIEISYQNQSYFLQPSPEYFIKRLLADSPGSYYSLAPCYRDDPITDFHNKEFLMLEYYLLGNTYEKARSLTEEIIKIFYPKAHFTSVPYESIFEQYLNLDLNKATLLDYHHICQQHSLDYDPSWSKQDLEDLLFGSICQKHLGKDSVLFVDKFPYEHRALSYFDKKQNFSYRFEVFIHGVEIANGYKECTEFEENYKRIVSWERQWRQSVNSKPPESKKFLSAVKDLPECSGVAFGFDRILMLCLKKERLCQSLLFPWSNL